MTNFPLCKAAGLKLWKISGVTSTDGEASVVCASEVEALLANAPVFSGLYNGTKPGQFEMHTEEYKWATHRCRAVLIEPLVQEPEEIKLLRELSEAHEAVYSDKCERVATYGKILERAKALLAKRDGGEK